MKLRKNSKILIFPLTVMLIAMMAGVLLTSCGTKKQNNSSSSSALSSSVSCLAVAPSNSNNSQLSSSASSKDKGQIIDDVSDALKEKYSDMNITNEWLGDIGEKDRYTVLFGSLKNDTQQGVALVIRTDPDGKQILSETRYSDLMRQGALKAVELGMSDIIVESSNGGKWMFSCFNGFSGSLSPEDKRQISDDVSDALRKKYSDMNITSQWQGNKNSDGRYTVLFGSLKSDPQQGVAQVVWIGPDGKQIWRETRYPDSAKNGALKVVELSATKADFCMTVEDESGNKRSFSCLSGFTVS